MPVVGQTVSNLSDLPGRAAQLWGEKCAVIAGENSWTFKEIDFAVQSAAAGLRDHGLRSGDVLTLYGENSWAWIIAYFAALRMGAVINPVNSMNSADELLFITADCRSRMVIASNKCLPNVPVEQIVIPFEPDGTHKSSIVELASQRRQMTLPTTADDVAAICYTSGTTGRPKGAVLTHAGILTNVAMTSLMHGRSASDVIYSALPLPHVYGNVVMNTAFLAGASLVLSEKFDAENCLRSIQQHQITMVEGVPTMYYSLLEQNIIPGEVQSLRICTVGGQSMPAPKMAEIEKRFGCPLIELWGMTELGGLGTTHPHTGPYRHGSIGTAMPFVETRIAAGTTSVDEAEIGAAGELLVRGHIVMRGYLNNEQATGEAIDTGGWLRTGDIAIKDSGGYLRIVDRKTDMILSGGFNIYPAEIERVLADHPMVAMSAVAPAYDELKGEIAVAFVVPRGTTVLSPADLMKHCRERLAVYKVPKTFRIVDDLPKTSTGKILRRALRDPQLDHYNILKGKCL